MECNCCDGGGKKAVTKNTFDYFIPTYWKLEVTDPFNIGWENLDKYPIIYMDGRNYYDLGDDRRVPITLIPVGNDERFDDNINRFFSVRILMPSGMQPDFSKPFFKTVVNGSVMGVAYAIVNSSYDVLVYSPMIHRNDDNTASWKFDQTKPIKSGLLGNHMIVYFSISKA